MPTLTPSVILQETVAQVFAKCPVLRNFSNEFTTERLKLGQDCIGHIRIRPTISDYDNTTGYKNGAQEGRSLLVDVPFKMTHHKHVTISLSHLNNLQDKKTDVQGFINDSASVLANYITRAALAEIHSGNFSNSTTETAANSDKDLTNKIRKELNKRGVSEDRFGLVDSDVAETLANDPRITNRYDDKSQDDGSAYISFDNLSGFRTISEDPAFGLNGPAGVTFTAAASTDLITTSAAHGLKVGQRVQITGLTGGTGLTDDAYYFVIETASTTTLKVSATRGGTVVNITVDASAGTITAKENLIGFFGSRDAIAVKTGLPTDGLELAAAMGVPTTAKAEIITDAASGLSFLAYTWTENATMNVFCTLAVIFGVSAGASMDPTGKLMEPSGQLLRSA